jgi:hypothetical protein
MGTIAETAIVLFADQGKQTSYFRFSFQQTSGSLPFHFPFAENKRKWPFFISQMSCYNIENLIPVDSIVICLKISKRQLFTI